MEWVTVVIEKRCNSDFKRFWIVVIKEWVKKFDFSGFSLTIIADISIALKHIQGLALHPDMMQAYKMWQTLQKDKEKMEA